MTQPSGESACLDENELVAFVAGQASAEARARVELHIDRCDDCRRIVAVIARSDGTDTLVDASPARSLAILPAGTVLADRFRLRRLVGRGGMGVVYEADDQLLRTRVAIKLLRPEVAREPALLERLHREILVGRRIGHPHVCRLYDLGTSGDVHFITMEFVAGETLEAYASRGAVTPERAAEILDQIASALQTAHAESVIHRDLKPANVMLDGDGNAKVMDFGLARDLRAAATLFGRPVGTPAYWAPEQALGDPATAASDLYALGRVALELFGGGAARKHDLNDVPAIYRRIVARCLELAPGDRYPSAAALRVDLSRARRPHTTSARRARMIAGALALAAGVLLIGWRIRAPIATKPVARAEAPVDKASVELARVELTARVRTRFIEIGRARRIEERLRLVERALAAGDARTARAHLDEAARDLNEGS